MREYFLLILTVAVVSVHCQTDLYIAETTDGTYCEIPFKYRGVTYHECTTEGSETPWCYIDREFSKWGYCKPKPDAFNGCKIGTPNVTLEEAQQIVDEHNKVRARMNTPRMRKLVWNGELAMKAQAAANKCEGFHTESELCGARSLTGQNLYITYFQNGYPDDLSWPKVVSWWSGEEKNFDIKTLKCAEGKLCGHFTQVVWDRSGFIGCAKAYCHGELWNRKNEVLYSILYYCNYYEAGNYDGEAPYKLTETNDCKECYLLNKELPKQLYRCDADNLCEACFNNKEGCQSLESAKQDKAGVGSDCVDVSPVCEMNKNLCKMYKSGNMPKPLLKYVMDCKLTCGIC